MRIFDVGMVKFVCLWVLLVTLHSLANNIFGIHTIMGIWMRIDSCYTHYSIYCISILNLNYEKIMGYTPRLCTVAGHAFCLGFLLLSSWVQLPNSTKFWFFLLIEKSLCFGKYNPWTHHRFPSHQIAIWEQGRGGSWRILSPSW